MEITLLDDLLRYLLFVHRAERPFLPDANPINTEAYNSASKQDIQAAMEKLMKDGYIRPPENLSAFNTRLIAIYKITYDGIIFISGGGYVQLLDEKEKSANQSFLLTKTLRRQAKLQIFLNCVVAVATLIAGIYYGIEIYKHW